MADLQALRELYAFMREEKILYARCGELELRLEPAPPLPLTPILPATGSDEQTERQHSPDGEGPADTERDSDRAFIEDLLYSSGGDPTPFIRALQTRGGAAA